MLYHHSKCAVSDCDEPPMGYPAQDHAFCERHTLESVVTCRDGVDRDYYAAIEWNDAHPAGAGWEWERDK